MDNLKRLSFAQGYGERGRSIPTKSGEDLYIGPFGLAFALLKLSSEHTSFQEYVF